MRLFPFRKTLLHRAAPALAAAALALLAIAPRAAAAPKFVLSGRLEELQALKLADTPGGPVSALDVLFYLEMSRHPLSTIPVEEFLAEEAERDPVVWAKIEFATQEYLSVLSLAGTLDARAELPRAQPEYLRRALLYPAAEAAWIDATIIKPGEIVITEADIGRYYITHAEKYGADPRYQVRYIFTPVDDMGDVDLQRDTVNELGALRDRIVKGELTFEQAAAQFSKAPSSAKGGLLPEFKPGDFFPEFEFQAGALKAPGDVSPAFIGKGGAYLIQLVSRQEAKRQARSEVDAEIRQALGHELVASYYRYFALKLAKTLYIQNLSALWPYTDLSAPVAMIGKARLERNQLLRINPSIINAAYDVQWSLVQKEASDWIEGEAILRDLEKRGVANHPYMAQAERIADTLMLAKANLAARVSIWKSATPDTARAALGLAQGETGLKQSRVVQVTIRPDDEAFEQVGIAEVTRIVMRQIGEKVEKGFLPTRPEEIEFAKTLPEAASAGEEDLKAEIKRLRGLLESSQYQNVQIDLRDLGWKDSSPILAWSPALVGLEPGRISAPAPLGNEIAYFLAVASRDEERKELLETPLLLQTLAFDSEKLALLRAEIARVAERKMLKFEAKPPAPPLPEPAAPTADAPPPIVEREPEPAE